MFARKPANLARPAATRRLRPEPVPRGLLVRTFVFGVAAILGAAWALLRHYSLTPAPMIVPVLPRTAPTYDADAGEIPVPEWFESPHKAP
jgi:hypothetical protein